MASANVLVHVYFATDLIATEANSQPFDAFVVAHLQKSQIASHLSLSYASTNIVRSLSNFLWNETLSLALLSDVESLSIRLDLMQRLTTHRDHLLSSVTVPITQRNGRQARYAVQFLPSKKSSQEATIYFFIQYPQSDRLGLVVALDECVAGSSRNEKVFIHLSDQHTPQASSVTDLFQIGSDISILAFVIFHESKASIPFSYVDPSQWNSNAKWTAHFYLIDDTFHSITHVTSATLAAENTDFLHVQQIYDEAMEPFAVLRVKMSQHERLSLSIDKQKNPSDEALGKSTVDELTRQLESVSVQLQAAQRTIDFFHQQEEEQLRDIEHIQPELPSDVAQLTRQFVFLLSKYKQTNKEKKLLEEKWKSLKLSEASVSASAFARSRAALRRKPKPVKKKLDHEELEEVQEAFRLFDTEGRGSVDMRELKAAMRALGFQVKKTEIRDMLFDIDKDETMPIDLETFTELMTTKMQSRDPREEILKIFRLFDDDNTGKISFRNLKRVCTELGENLTDQEMQEMIDEADRDGDGLINEEEFFRVMKKRSENPLDDLDSDDD
ncbi:unnamed protein product [Albugo candida]|uniref:Uncharacterized protein n=1 Tax=Albugo candida TaxID=65357 RepID=A0A024G8E0_9STRA|nr:unnamed protein product [Albugo candida]|eukprot:CCI42597.1 unnamed protein product [Albugo candida]